LFRRETEKYFSRRIDKITKEVKWKIRSEDVVTPFSSPLPLEALKRWKYVKMFRLLVIKVKDFVLH